MWLINTSSLTLQYFHQAEGVNYAILSHTWENDEMTFQDMQNLHARQELRSTEGFQKMEACCKQALSDRLSYAWVDTCCIDKSSSSELSEAINSMFGWYANAVVCYAYLADVPWFSWRNSNQQPEFSASRWFSRGWTLQELLSPSQVLFFSQDWRFIGNKLQMCQTISCITGIDKAALLGRPMAEFSVAERMSWAAFRMTTRTEDIAYSLLGIFNIHMPLLYGEGVRAFRRLQEQILETTEDYSIFCWTGLLGNDSSERFALLAPSPLNFDPKALCFSNWKYSELSSRSLHYFMTRTKSMDPVCGNAMSIHPPTVTSRGIRMTLPLLHSSKGQITAILTSCNDEAEGSGKWLCLTLECDPKAPTMSRRHNSLTLRTSQDIVNASITEIYGRREDENLCVNVFKDWQVVLLMRICDETLKECPSKDPVELCRRLGPRAAWCSDCVAYSPVYKNYTAWFRSDARCARCNRTAILSRIQEYEAHDQSVRHPYMSNDYSARKSFTQIPGESAELLQALQAVDRFEPDADNDIRLSKMESLLDTGFGELPTSLMRLLICCLVAVTQQRIRDPVVMSYRARLEEGRFLSSLVQALRDCSSVGAFGLRLCAEQGKLGFEAGDNILRVNLAIAALRCCQSIAQADESALNLADLALSWYGLSFNKRFNRMNWPGSSQSFFSTVTTFTNPETAVLNWQRACGTIPPVSDRDHFVSWLRRLYDFYTGEMTRDEKAILFNALRSLDECVKERGGYHFNKAHIIEIWEITDLFHDITIRDPTFSTFKANLRGSWRWNDHWDSVVAQLRQDLYAPS